MVSGQVLVIEWRDVAIGDGVRLNDLIDLM